jgi:endonuclease G, mitochondrial
MLRFLQISFLVVLSMAVACFAVWHYFHGGVSWVAAMGALIAYAGFLSSFFLGSSDAWHKKAIHVVHGFALSTVLRAGLSLVFLMGVTVYLGVLVVKALQADTAYYEVRVYDKVDLPANYQVGAKVTVHSRIDGLTHLETVSNDGAAIFRSLKVPTTLTYQLEIISANPPFVTGDNDKIDSLPDLLDINVALIPNEKRMLLKGTIKKPAFVDIPRPANYLLNIDERGDKSLQTGNAPWGVPQADLVLNRLGYVLGYDLERKLPRWVAYAIGPSEQSIPRTQKFLADPAIDFNMQARMSDYRGQGYDRGHMISPADLFFKGPVTIQEAYYMSTVTPQTPWLNRRLWRTLEIRVRKAVESRQQVAFIIAGPLFIKPEENPDFKFETIGDGRIPVPTHFFRIMAMMNSDQTLEVFGFIAPNAKEGTFELNEYVVSINEIEKKSRLVFFPLLNPQTATKIKADKGLLW